MGMGDLPDVHDCMSARTTGLMTSVDTSAESQLPMVATYVFYVTLWLQNESYNNSGITILEIVWDSLYKSLLIIYM